jgi:hypothetical protein
MDNAISIKLAQLSADFESVTGRQFAHFYCPILLRDEDTTICKAHIINTAFQQSDRSWTIQRKDVDSFYGSMLESDFVTLQERGKHTPLDVLTDKGLTRSLRPKILIDGREVRHYVADSPVPSHFSPFLVEKEGQSFHLALKLHPNDTFASLDANWQIMIKSDLRIAALGSLLKAAHLTLFELIGYQYALSAGGHFLGFDILGRFFLENSGKPRSEVRKNAECYFRQFANMVRPVASAPSHFAGTVSDRLLYLCPTRSQKKYWAMLILVRTGTQMHAVLVPVFEDAESAALFLRFLEKPLKDIEVRLAQLNQGHWAAAKETKTFKWPPADISDRTETH